MTVQLHLPASLEQLLQTEVEAGVYESLEDAIITKLLMADAPPFEPMTREETRADLEKAWNERGDGIPADQVFDELRRKSAELKAKGL